MRTLSSTQHDPWCGGVAGQDVLQELDKVALTALRVIW
jgi:hypothetical protein